MIWQCLLLSWGSGATPAAARSRRVSLSCPSCHRLIHAGRLKELAASAENAERAGEPLTALASWQEAITLLPQQSRQYAVIADRISRLGRQVESQPGSKASATNLRANPGGPTPPVPSPWSGGVISGVIGTLALAIWKFKFLAAILLTKGKFLLLGLTKASTFFSMLASFGVYWTVFGAWFALGIRPFDLHSRDGPRAVLMRYGVQASAPLFLPGIGAVIRLRQGFIDPRQDARVGLAGPIWGLGAAAACAGVYAVSQRPIWAALASVGALINLFNLLPIWQLDGGRAFRSLTRPHRWLAVAAVATAWVLTQDERLIALAPDHDRGAARTVVEKPAKGSRPGRPGAIRRPGRRPFGPGPDAGSQTRGVWGPGTHPP